MDLSNTPSAENNERSERLTESRLFKILGQINHPEFTHRNLVELGMVESVSVNEGNIIISLALPFLHAPIKDELISTVRKAVTSELEGTEIEISTTEMNPKQRKAFSEFAKRPKSPAHSRGKIHKVIAVMSGKGGVGKSTVAGLIALSLKRLGYDVGILDADITGPSIPRLFGVKGHPIADERGIHPVESTSGIVLMSMNLLLSNEDQPVVWRGPMIGKAIEQFWGDIAWGDLDFLITDLPPGTSDAALTVMQTLPLEGIILVTTPQDLAGMVVRKAANMAKHLNIPLIGLVENMSHLICPHCQKEINTFGPSTSHVSAELIDTPMLGHIPLDPTLTTLCDGGRIEDYINEELGVIMDVTLKKILGQKAGTLAVSDSHKRG